MADPGPGKHFLIERSTASSEMVSFSLAYALCIGIAASKRPTIQEHNTLTSVQLILQSIQSFVTPLMTLVRISPSPHLHSSRLNIERVE